MRLLEVGIKNFKSLRDVTFKPGDLNVLIGPNGAGKSNLADALDFIGEIYRHSLESAVAGRGGYGNICHRRSGRSAASISFHVTAQLSARSFPRRRSARSKQKLPREIIVTHSLQIRKEGDQSNGSFRVFGEQITYEALVNVGEERRSILELHRNSQHKVRAHTTDLFAELDRLYRELPIQTLADFVSEVLTPHQSLLHVVETSLFPIIPVRELLGTIYTSQISVRKCRDDGVPGPHVRLGRHGENLPAVVDTLRREHPKAFDAIMETLETIMPMLEHIDVESTPQKTLRLSFQERGFAAPWTVGQVSDGTVRALGLLAAVFDPESGVAIIEEPENSLHPWAIRQFVEACRLASTSKQIFLTSHSPVVVDYLRPEEIWVVSKRQNETGIAKLDQIDPDASEGWKAGEFTLSEYLGSGIVPQAVPSFAQ